MKQTIQSNNMPLSKNAIIFLSAIFLVAIYAALISYPIILKNIYKTAFPVATSSINSLVVVYLSAYVILQIPIGLLIDRIGIYRSLFICALLFLLTLITFAFASSYISFFFSRVAMGVAASFSFILAIYIAKRIFYLKYFNMLVGFIELIFSLSIALMPYILKTLSHYTSWQTVTLLMSGLLIFVCAFNFLCKTYRYKHIYPPLKFSENKQISQQLKQVFFDKNYWYISLMVGIFYTHFVVFTEIYGPTYIQKVYHMSYIHSVFVNDSGLLGYMMGCLTLGICVPIFSSRKAFFIATLGSTLIYSIIILWHSVLADSGIIRYVLYFLIGFLSAYILLAFRLYEILTEKPLTATASAAILTVLNLLPILFFNIYLYFVKINPAYGRLFLFFCFSTAMLLALRLIISKRPSAQG